jgi:hypothetical protein
MKRFVRATLGKLGYRSYHHRHFRDARTWSNREIRRFAGLYDGDVINVSAWEDKDKEGGVYRDYFASCRSYYISNFGTDQGVVQGAGNEFVLDLEKPLAPELRERFELVFNHTTLEHVFDFREAFANLCGMSSDSVMIVVPWLQKLHATYGDYWRFSPQAVAKLFEHQGFTTVHLSWTETPRTAVYVFAIATRHPERWAGKIGRPVDTAAPDFLVAQETGAGAFAF